MTQTTSTESESAWNRAGEEPPTRSSPLSEIAEYVEWRMADLSFSFDPATGECETIPVGRAIVRDFCEEEDFPWSKVAAELRYRQFGHSSTTVTDIRETDHGIVVRISALANLTYGLAPLCHYYKRRISRADFVFRKVPKDCGSWACEMCGPALAEVLFAQLRNVLGRESTLYMAETKYRRGLPSMMVHRRATARAEVFWYRDVNDAVTYISTKPLPGTKEAWVWRPVSAREAIELLRTALWVPGHRDHGFSPGWEPDRPPDEKAVGGMEGFDVDGLSDAQVHQALAIFSEEAKRNFNVDVATGYIPPEHRRALEALMEDVLAQVRAGSESL